MLAALICIITCALQGWREQPGQDARCRYLRGEKREDKHLVKAFSSQDVCSSIWGVGGAERKGKGPLFLLPTSACLSPIIL